MLVQPAISPRASPCAFSVNSRNQGQPILAGPMPRPVVPPQGPGRTTDAFAAKIFRAQRVIAFVGKTQQFGEWLQGVPATLEKLPPMLRQVLNRPGARPRGW